LFQRGVPSRLRTRITSSPHSHGVPPVSSEVLFSAERHTCMCVYRVSEVNKIGYATTLVSTISDHVSRMLSSTQLVQNFSPRPKPGYSIALLCVVAASKGVCRNHVSPSKSRLQYPGDDSHNALISWYNC